MMLYVSSKFTRQCLLLGAPSRVARPVLFQCYRTVWTKDDAGIAVKSVWEKVQEKAAAAKEYATDKSKQSSLSEKADAAKEFVSEKMEVAKEKATAAKEFVIETSKNAKVSEKAAAAKDFVIEQSKNAKVSEKADAAKEFVSEKMEVAKEKASAAGKTVWQNVQNTADEVKVKAAQLGKQAAENLEAKAGDAKVYFDKLSQEDTREKSNAKQKAGSPDSTEARVERAAREAREKAERYLEKYPEGLSSGATIAEKVTNIGHHAEEVTRAQPGVTIKTKARSPRDFGGDATGETSGARKETAQRQQQPVDTGSGVERAAREAREKAKRYLDRYPEGFTSGETIAEKVTTIGHHAEEVARAQASVSGTTIKAKARSPRDPVDGSTIQASPKEPVDDAGAKEEGSVGKQVNVTEGVAAEIIKEQAQRLKNRIHEDAEAERQTR